MRASSKLAFASVFSLLFVVASLSAAPTYVTGNANACTASSCAVTLASTNAGDLIVLALFVWDSTSVSNVSDTQGNPYTLIGSPQTWSSHNFVERLYYAKNIKGGADTATVTLSGSKYMEVRVYEYSGLDPSSPLDGSATPSTGTSVTGTSGTLTTTNASDLLFGFFQSDNNVSNTAGSGFTPRTFALDGYPLAEDLNVSVAGSYSAMMLFSGSADYVGFLVAFKAASGGGGGAPNISAVSVSPVTATTAVVSWTTNVTATSRVDYGTTASYGSNVSDATLVTSHSLALSSLACNTTYHYQITSVGSGGTATTPDATFTTASCSTGGPPAYISGNTNACTASSCAVTLASTNPGDLIVLALFVLDSTSVSNVSDTQGNQYTLIGSPQTWSSHNFVERLYYAKNIKGGADTATVTLSGSKYMEVRVYEYSGLDPSSPLDASATPSTGTSVTGTSGTLTTTNASDLLFGFFQSDNNVSNTAGSGFTPRTFAIDGYPLAEDLNVSVAGSYSAMMLFSGSADYVGFLVAFKAASGGGGGAPNISAVSVSPVTATTAVVSWTTNVTATSRVDYGTTASYGSNVSDSTSGDQSLLVTLVARLQYHLPLPNHFCWVGRHGDHAGCHIHHGFVRHRGASCVHQREHECLHR